MARDDKIIRKMKQSPRSIRFEEMDGLLKRQGFIATQRGSHVQYRHPNGTRFSIVKPHGKDKTVNQNAVKEVVDRIGL